MIRLWVTDVPHIQFPYSTPKSFKSSNLQPVIIQDHSSLFSCLPPTRSSDINQCWGRWGEFDLIPWNHAEIRGKPTNCSYSSVTVTGSVRSLEILLFIHPTVLITPTSQVDFAWTSSCNCRRVQSSVVILGGMENLATKQVLNSKKIIPEQRFCFLSFEIKLNRTRKKSLIASLIRWFYKNLPFLLISSANLSKYHLDLQQFLKIHREITMTNKKSRYATEPLVFPTMTINSLN